MRLASLLALACVFAAPAAFAQGTAFVFDGTTVAAPTADLPAFGSTEAACFLSGSAEPYDRSPGVRWAHRRHESGAVTLFADGEALPVPDGLAHLAALLTSTRALTPEALAPHLPHAETALLLAALHAAGAVQVVEAT